jgi:hypothetical protein
LGLDLQGPDADPPAVHQGDRPEEAAGVYPRVHGVPLGPEPAQGSAIVLVGFLRTVDLHQELVGTTDHEVRAVELEGREVAFVAPQELAV